MLSESTLDNMFKFLNSKMLQFFLTIRALQHSYRGAYSMNCSIIVVRTSVYSLFCRESFPSFYHNYLLHDTHKVPKTNIINVGQIKPIINASLNLRCLLYTPLTSNLFPCLLCTMTCTISDFRAAIDKTFSFTRFETNYQSMAQISLFTN